MMEINKDILSEITKYLNLDDSTQLRIVNKYFYSQIKAPKPEEIRIFKSEKYLKHIKKTIEMIRLEDSRDISTIINLIVIFYIKNKIIIEHCIKLFEKYENLEKDFLFLLKDYFSIKDTSILFKYLIKKFKIRVSYGFYIKNEVFTNISFEEFDDCMNNHTEYFFEKILSKLKHYSSASGILHDLFQFD